jgi:hypothetical protein
VGPHHRTAGLQRHRVAVPAHGRPSSSEVCGTPRSVR